MTKTYARFDPAQLGPFHTIGPFVARGAEMLWSEALGFGLHHLRPHSLTPIYHRPAIDDRCCVPAREPLVMHERTEPSAVRENHIYS